MNRVSEPKFSFRGKKDRSGDVDDMRICAYYCAIPDDLAKEVDSL